ncbi:MAG: NADH-quinone oxidoreductase subunit M, partial [Chloroflexi bacterium]|nr:NADH-quinone oxidoreductase subunit M [Chloroflexota bacterium]
MADGIHGLLTTVVFLPLVGALLIALFVKGDKRVRFAAGAIMVAELALSVVVFAGYDRSAGGLQFVDRVSSWIPIESMNIEYFLGVDGLSAPMVLLTGLLGFVAVFGSFRVKLRVREYFVWLLILQTAVMGVFTSLDFVMFFLLWELELIPMFFLISIWGSGRREYSAMKFLIFTFLGSAFMLVGILVLFFSTGTFDMTALPEKIEGARLLLPAGAIFGLLFVGFAIKLPVWPLHTWLPDAHTDAPTAVSVMLAGVLLKMGGYGMIRVTAFMFPDVMSDLAWLLAAAGAINILYGAVVTLRQTDLKRLVAFSSISHMGFVLLGLASIAGVAGGANAVGITGAALQMFTHGTITGLMFLVVGMIYDRAHTRYIPDLGGLASRMPALAAAFLIAGLASLGLPGTSGFVAEILIFLGVFPVWGWVTAFAAIGVVITAGYVLWMIQRTMFGPRLPRWDELRDPRPWEFIPVAVLIVMILVVGIYPA